MIQEPAEAAKPLEHSLSSKLQHTSAVEQTNSAESLARSGQVELNNKIVSDKEEMKSVYSVASDKKEELSTNVSSNDKGKANLEQTAYDTSTLNSNLDATLDATQEADTHHLHDISKQALATPIVSSVHHSESICCIRLSALGDCINAFGVLGAIKRSYPDIKLLWMIDKRFAPLFCDEQGHDLIPMLRLDFKAQGLRTLFKIKKSLSKMGMQKFDAVLNMQTSIKASLSSCFIKAEHKYGYDPERTREKQNWFVDRHIDPSDNPHVLAGFMQFPRKMGLNIVEPYWNFALDPYLIDNALSTVGRETKVCALSPCSAKPAKNWTLSGYIELIKYAQSRGMTVILLGGRSELELNTCKTLATQCPNVINLCGRTNLRELAAYLSISRLVVAPDSGSMHLASALGTPVIGLFAVHDDQRVGPWNFMDLNVSVYGKLARAELKSDKIPWRYRVRDPKAMQQINVDMVINTFDHALSRYRI